MTLDHLTPLEQGVLYAALLDGARAAARLERVGGPLGERASAALQELLALDTARRRACVAALSRDLFSPLPAHLERIDPSWIEAVLVGEPPIIVGAVLQSLPGEIAQRIAARGVSSALPAATRLLVCRVVLGRLAVMPPQAPATDLRAMAALPSWSAGRLRAALASLGRLTLAALAIRVDPELRRGLLDRLGTPLADELRRAMDRPPIRMPRLLSLDALDLTTPAETLLRLGIQLLRAAPDLAARQQVAQLLPRHLGLPLLDGASPIAQTPAVLETLQRADREAREERP